MTCKVCNGALRLIGFLGRLAWFRCEDCGCEWSIDRAELDIEESED